MNWFRWKDKIAVSAQDDPSREKENHMELRGGLLNLPRIFLAAFQKFIDDSAFIRANAIAYSVVISIIPLLTILVKYAEVDQETIRVSLIRFMAAYGITDSTEILNFLDGVMKRANAIAGAGTIFMIYAATNVLRHTEDSFNYIFRAEKERPLLYRFSLYIASLLILPGILILLGGVIRIQVARLTPASYISVHTVDPVTTLITESQGRLILRSSSDKEEDRIISLAQRIDEDLPFRAMYFDLRSGKAGRSWELPGEPIPETSEKRIITSEDINQIQGSAVYGDSIYLISSTGVFFESNDRGNTWKYFIFYVRADSSVRSPHLEDIFATEDGRILILGSSGFRSMVLSRDNDRYSVRALDSMYRRVIPVDRGEALPPELFLTGNGKYYRSLDYGRNWIGPFVEKYGNRSIPIYTIHRDSDGTLFFGGSDGAFWIRHPDGKEEFPDLRTRYNQTITGMIFQPDGSGIAYGENNLFRYTPDHGSTWLIPDQPVFQQTTFHAHRINPDGSLLLVGSEETLLKTREKGVTKTLDSSGYPSVRYSVLQLDRYPVLRTWLLYGFLYASILISVFGFFLLVYLYLPNARVDLWPAMAGSLFTSVVFILFALAFRIFLDAMGTTRFIYGVWAVVPVGMIVLLFANQIVLFGLELAYVLQHPHVYRKKRTRSTDYEEALFWNSLLMISLVYRNIYRKNTPLTDRALMKYFDRNTDAIRITRENLVAGGYISYQPVSGEYFPVRPPEDIHVSSIQDFLMKRIYISTNTHVPGDFRKIVNGIQEKIKKQVHGISGDMTIRNLIDTMEKKPDIGPKASKKKRNLFDRKKSN